MSKRARGLSTRAIHTPPLPSGPGEAVVGPIVASTTFAFERVADLGRVIAEEEYGFTYARLRNPTVEELNAVVAQLEGAEAAQSFGSGMAAISAALHSTLAAGDTLLLPRQLYGTTFDLAEKQLRPRGVEIEYLDVTDIGRVGATGARSLRRDDGEPGLPAGRPRRDRGHEGRRPDDRRQHLRLAGALPAARARRRHRLRVGDQVPQRPSRRHRRGARREARSTSQPHAPTRSRSAPSSTPSRPSSSDAA